MNRKKPRKVKRTRSQAAKAGWVTRRKNAKKAASVHYEREIKKLEKQLKKDFEEARKKALIQRAVLGLGKIGELVEQLPKRDRKKAFKDIIQQRMDKAVRIYGDVRTEAWDLLEELFEYDYEDISDIYDAWDYEEGAA